MVFFTKKRLIVSAVEGSFQDTNKIFQQVMGFCSNVSVYEKNIVSSVIKKVEALVAGTPQSLGKIMSV